MNYFWPFLSTFVLSVLFSGVLTKIGYRLGLVSKPRERDIHQKPVPRIGGIGIFLSFLIVSLIVFLFVHPNLAFGGSQIFGTERRLLGIWIGGIAVTSFMFVDDLLGLKPWQKLIGQIVVGLIAIGAGIGIDHLANPFGTAIDLNSVYIPLFKLGGAVYKFSLWSDLLTLVWLVGMMNIINFIDGVDGLAGGLSSISAFIIFLLSITVAVSQPATAMISIILAGASLGFLVWNFPPAKIFMGDSGSMFLGFMLGILPLISGGKLATVFLVLGFPIVDGLAVAFGRLGRGKNPLTTPDKTHLHHRFLKAGFTPRQAVLSLYAISAAFGWIALRSSTLGKMIGAVCLVGLTFLLIFLLQRRARRARTI